jgi:crossover junction endodeoxyribonuclease RusA
MVRDMTTLLEFDVRGIIPETKGSWRSVGRGRLIPDNPKSASWENAIAWMARQAISRKAARGVSFSVEPERVGVVLLFVLPPPPSKAKKYRRDIDKLARAALDALTGIVYADDEQVDELEVSKITDTNAASWGVHVRVYRLEFIAKEQT